MKNLKKMFSFIFVLVCLLGVFAFTACDDSIDKEDLEALLFEDLTVDYDGEVHKLSVENIYEEEGVTVTYTNNNNSKPGVYTITATISYNDIKVFKTAKLTINSLASDLHVETEQYVYLYGGDVFPKYTIGNDVQKIYILNEDGEILTVEELCKPGTYKIEIYAAKSSIYAESEHFMVNLHVIDSNFGLYYEDTTVIYDGTEKEITLTGEVPSGYTVEYVNNKGTEAGSYYAIAHVKDSTGKTVETHAATLTIENQENVEFETFLDEFFVEYLEGDQLSVNIFCEQPENFGLEHYDASWYTYTPIEEGDIEESIAYFEELLSELRFFEDKPLSDLQEVAYRTIEDFLQYYLDLYAIEDVTFMRITYVDQFGGYVADFGTYMESYSLRTEQEVIDVINYIKSTKEAFPSYVDFVAEKVARGYALSDFTLNEMRNYLAELLESGEDYYLKDILTEKINKLDFLTSDQKTSYINQVADAITNYFVPGVQALYDGLAQFLGLLPEEEEGYWQTYENGKELYLLQLEDLLGIKNLDVSKYIAELDKTLKIASEDSIRAQKRIVDKYQVPSWEAFQKVINANPIFDGTPEEMMEYLKEFAKTLVPELKSNPDITIKEMDEASAKVSNAVAYYMKSALDNTKGEYVTLNPTKLSEDAKNDLIGTLAHEGYPGHLYAYVYSKELGLSNIATIMTSTAHGEGWATYVELKLYEYAKSLSNDSGYKIIMDYLYASQLSGFLLETRIDVGIHYEGWDVERVSEYLDDLGYNGGAAQGIYDLIIEMPTGYAAYGYGKLTFYNLHQEAKEILGGFYDEVEFNAMLLSKGWTSLGELQDTYEDYMLAKCHKHGLTFE